MIYYRRWTDLCVLHNSGRPPSRRRLYFACSNDFCFLSRGYRDTT